MKHARLLSLALALLLLSSLLTGCVFLTGCDNGEIDMVSFDDMVYERPALNDALAEADALIETLSSGGAKERAVRAALDGCFETFRGMRTMESISTIRSDSDVTDDYYRAEMDFCTDAVITYRAKLDEVFAACAASPLKAQLDDYFGAGFLDSYGEDYVYPEALFNLQKQENELENRYYAALAAQRVTLGGQDYTVDELYTADRNGTLGVPLRDALDAYYTAANETLGSIYIELVRVRHALAAEAGYDSYLDMAYDLNDRDYTPAQAAKFSDAVQTFLVPLYREAKTRGLADEAYYGTPELDADDACMTVMDIADAMGGDIADTAEFLIEYDLINAEVSDRKVSDSYELYIPNYEAPYILAGTVGYAEDILTIAHELGHAVDDFVHYEADDSTDVSETLSQAMEYLMIPYLQDDALYEAVLAYKLTDVLVMYAQQGSFNDFEERVYALPEEALTLENVNAIALSATRSFALESEWGETYDAMSWVEITHFFQQPLYVVSYIASDALAIQFYERELAQQGAGLALWKDAVDRAGDTEFLALAEALNLRDPLSTEQVEAIAKLMREALHLN